MNDDKLNDFIKKRPFPAYDGDGKYIFISYSHKDAEIVFSELKKFKNEKYNIWYDQGIDIGIDWDDAIAEALEACSLFVCFISKNSLASSNVINEIKFADDENKDIILIYLDESQLTGGLKLRLRNRQSILKFTMSPQEYSLQWKKAFKKFITPEQQKPPSSQNFDYLNDLIQNGGKSINLDFYIKIKEDEKSRYREGISLDVDNLVIDGNKHFIDANFLNRIFNITGKNILIKNCTFKNGHNSFVGSEKHETGGGAIFIDKDASVSFFDCKFLNNHSESDGGAIFNKGNMLSAKKCNFENNSSKLSGGAVANLNKLNIFKSIFKENKSHNGGAIYNYHESSLSIRDSKFRNNSSEMFAGAIYNYGDLKAEECSFSNNFSKGGGAVMNYGHAEISSTSFKGNSSTFGGAIFNMAKNLVHYSNNHSTNLIDDGYIKVVDCNFASNSAIKLGGVICNLSKSKFDRCIFGKNTASSFSHFISNGPEGILKNDNTVELTQFISVLTIVGCDFRIGGILENNAIYNQKNCLLTIDSQTVLNKKSAKDNSNILLNRGKIEFN